MIGITILGLFIVSLAVVVWIYRDIRKTERRDDIREFLEGLHSVKDVDQFFEE